MFFVVVVCHFFCSRLVLKGDGAARSEFDVLVCFVSVRSIVVLFCEVPFRLLGFVSFLLFFLYETAEDVCCCCCSVGMLLSILRR